jgi:hypothetical protein
MGALFFEARGVDGAPVALAVAAPGAEAPEVPPTETTVVTRPPAGPARGLIPVPAWAVVIIAAALILGALAYLFATRRGRK